MTNLTAIFIDDEPDKDSTTRVIDILQDGGVKCELNPPPQLENLQDLTCDLFITDFELAKVRMPGITFSGNTLSTEYRNHHPNTPIVLLTQDGIFSKRSRQVRTDNTDLDLIWYKNKVAENPSEFINEVISLANGFRLLVDEFRAWKDSTGKESSNHSKPPEWRIILKLMNATEEEFSQLREANSPIQRGQWIVPEIAEWIRSVIIEYPGILLDYRHVAVRIGMNPDDFMSDMDLQRLFEPAEYKGIFHEFGKRWWRDRLIEIASELLISNNVNKPLLEGFVPTYNQTYSKTNRHSVCIWDNTEIADTICFIEQKPVKSRNSLLYRPDNRPAIMDQARVSRWAITRNNDFDEFLVDSDSMSIALRWMNEG